LLKDKKCGIFLVRVKIGVIIFKKNFDIKGVKMTKIKDMAKKVKTCVKKIGKEEDRERQEE